MTLEHDCLDPKSLSLIVKIGEGRCWLELCPVCGPHTGDQIKYHLDGKLYRVEHVQGGPWPHWKPGVGVRYEDEPYRHTFFVSDGYPFNIVKRREELVAERLMA